MRNKFHIFRTLPTWIRSRRGTSPRPTILFSSIVIFAIAIAILPIPALAQPCVTPGDCPSGYRCEGGEMFGGRLRGATCVQGDIFIHVCCNAQNERMQIGDSDFWLTAQECSAVCTQEGLECRTRTCEPPAPPSQPHSVIEDLVEPRLQIDIPGLQPFTRPEKFTTPEGRTFINIGYLGQYIVGIYTWLVGIVGIIAGLMIIYGGLKWLTSGGSPDRINDAKGKIINALVGMVLALGSYAILKAINPDLILFRPLRVEVVEKITLTQLEMEEEYVGSRGSGQTICNTVDKCKELVCNKNEREWPPYGGKTIPANQTEPIPDNIPGIQSAGPWVRVTAKMLAQLRTAGAIAQQNSPPYTIKVGDGYRPLKSQIKNVCDIIRKAEENPTDQEAVAKRDNLGHATAWPGGSNHGSGDAIDIELRQGNKLLSCAGSSCGQIGFEAQKQPQWTIGAEKLADIMFQAGFVRYCREIWHFELPTTTPCRRNNCRSNTLEDLSC